MSPEEARLALRRAVRSGDMELVERAARRLGWLLLWAGICRAAGPLRPSALGRLRAR